MKLFGREAKTSDGKKEIEGAAGGDSRPDDQEREEAGRSKKDAVDSMRTVTTATPSESYRSNSSKPVDLDDLYDDTSDASVGDATETSISHSYSDSRGEAASAGQHEDNRMAALVHTMAEKQEGISDGFYHMIKKLTKTVQQMEQQHQQDSVADEKAKSKAKRHVEKALEMQETAKTMATKQTRIAQQFVALVHRLEHESAELAAANQGLRRQLQTARVILKDEAGVELEDVSTTQHSHATPTHHKGGARNPQTPRSSSGGSHNNNNSKSKRPPLTNHHHHHHRSSRSAHSSPASTIHPIKEICFSNTVVDVTELMSSTSATLNNNSHSEDAADVTAMTTPLKESSSSDSPGAAASESSPRAVANTDNLRFLL